MLIAFDATARHGSFSCAAREIRLTPGAVNRQVTALEEQLDVKLFTRYQKQLELTEIGQEYAVDVQAALLTLRNAALAAIGSPLSCSLNLGLLPAFGARWLMPRFPSFVEEHPNITVNFVTKLSPFNFGNENLDAAIHCGTEDWPEVDYTYLMGEVSVPVCAPSLLGERLTIAVDDFSRLPLLHLRSRPDNWNDWFASIEVDAPRSPGGMLFEQFSTITQAAVAGLGVALIPRFLVQRELDSGELISPIDKPLTSNLGYYLVAPIHSASNPQVSAFREWLQNTVAEEEV